MASANILEFGFGLDIDSMSYPDLAKYSEEYLGRVKSLRDIEGLIKSLNPALKDSRYTEEERHELKKLRQRAYDRRRNSRFQTLESREADKPDPNSKSGLSLDECLGRNGGPNETPIPSTEPPPPAADLQKSIVAQAIPSTAESLIPPQVRGDKSTFWQGAKRAFASIDGEQVVTRLPATLLRLGSTLLVIWFLWLQSVDLYESVGFSNPRLTAVGSLLMVVGFAGIHSLSRSKLGLLLCIYAGAYESYFMIAGTIQDEAVRHLSTMDADSELLFLREKVERARASYSAANARYLQQGSDVFMNSWFKKRHLDPAWQDYATAQQKAQARLKQLAKGGSRTDITVLKLLYRLGIVLLSMILVHGLCSSETTIGNNAIGIRYVEPYKFRTSGRHFQLGVDRPL